jgi:hypothetical protein
LPPAISRCCAQGEDEIEAFFAEHTIVVPDDFPSRDVALAMVDARGKELVTVGEDSVRGRFNVEAIDIARAMTAEEIPEDVVYLVDEIIAMCALQPA